jgi:glycosyltransferase A (GT-A) superfamily protein (DUF2064 family)
MPAKKKQQALIIFLEDTNRDLINSRLTDVLTSQEKNRLYNAFLEDTIYTCLQLANTALRVVYPSDAAREVVGKSIGSLEEKLAPRLKKVLKSNSFSTLAARGDNQGDRLRNAFEHIFDEGFSPAVLIGCVTPTLSRKVLQNAYRHLKRSDIVFGPTLEGSYYLVGLNRMENDMFHKIDWVSERPVYSQMVDTVSDSGLKWHELELWYDLRQPEDFEFLIRDINFFRQIGDERSASKTEEILDEILKKMP